MNRRLLTLLLALAFSSLGVASQLHVGAPIQASQPTEGPVQSSAYIGTAATDGSSYLIVTSWYAESAVTLVDSSGVVISSHDFGLGQINEIPLVRWDGTQYIVFTTGWAIEDRRVLRATKVARDGTIGETIELRRDIVGVPVMAFDGSNYAVAYGWVNVAYYNKNLEYRGIDMQLVLAGDVQQTPAIAADGSGFVVLYSARASGGSVEVRTARLDNDGQVLASSVIVSGATPDAFRYLRIASNGSNYIAAWQSGEDAYANLLDSNGAPLGMPVRVATGNVIGFVGRLGDTFLLSLVSRPQLLRVTATPALPGEVLSSDPDAAASDILDTPDHTLILSTSDAVGGVIYDLAGTAIRKFSFVLRPITRRGASAPILRWGRTTYLAAWKETRWIDGSPVEGLALHTLNVDGTASGPTHWFASETAIEIAYGDGEFALLSTTADAYVARRISAEGDVVDAEPRVLIAVPQVPPYVMGPCGQMKFAWDGAAFRLVYTDCQQCKFNFAGGAVHSIRMTASGEVGPPELLDSTSMFNSVEAFACGDGQCLLAWTGIHNACPDFSDTVSPIGRASRIESGNVIDPTPLNLSDTTGAPRLASSGDRYLAVWNTGNWGGNRVYLGIVNREGAVVAGAGNTIEVPEFRNLMSADLIWDGRTFLVYADSLENEPGPGVPQVWATKIVRVDPNAERVDSELVAAPLLESVDSSRDGRSIALTLREVSPGVTVVDAVPLVEASRMRAVRR